MMETQFGAVERQLLRLSDVLAMTGVARSTLRRQIRKGLFPEPLRWGTIRVWRRADVEAALADLGPERRVGRKPSTSNETSNGP